MLQQLKLRHLVALVIICACYMHTVSAIYSVNQFNQWYPQYGKIFKQIVADNCSEEYKLYKSGDRSAAGIDFRDGGDKFNLLTQPLIDCILDETSEFLKGVMTSAQVLLGVMPTILALLGPSHDELAMLSVIGRRPVLTTLIAVASPSAYFSRALEYSNPSAILSKGDDRRPLRQLKTPIGKASVSVLEYIIAAAAAANVIHNTVQLEQRTVNSVSSETDFFPFIWLMAGLAIHAFSWIVFHLRMRGARRTQDDLAALGIGNRTSRPGLGAKAKSVVATLTTYEWISCAAGGYCIHISTRQETKKFLGLAWLESIVTIIHIIFGTLVYSSTLFIGTRDALGVVGRYMAGVTVCRVILMYELAGLRESCNSIEKRHDSDATLSLNDEGRPREVIKRKPVPFTRYADRGNHIV